MLTDSNADFSINSLNRMKCLLGKQTGIKLLALGYTDIEISLGLLSTHCNNSQINLINFIDVKGDINNPATICRIEPVSFYHVLGFDVLFLDLFYPPNRNPDVVRMDLNEPLPAIFQNQFDVVLDGGTIEHCYNAPQAMKSCAEAVKIGGILNNGNPLFSLNHGFYNFSPIFYTRFFEVNGFSLLEMYCSQHVNGRLNSFLMPASSQELYAQSTWGEDFFINTLARKEEMRTIIWPSQ